MSTELRLWDDLRALGVVADDAPPADTAAPWYVHLMLGLSAWLAAIFLLGSFGALFHELWSSVPGMLVLGGVCCGVALALLAISRAPDGRERLFFAQLALPVSLSGQALLMLAVAEMTSSGDGTAVGATMAAVGTAMAAAGGQPLHRFASCAVALAGVAIMMFEAGVQAWLAPACAVATAVVWLAVVRGGGGAARWRPPGYALALALLAAVWWATHDRVWFEAVSAAGEAPRTGPLAGAAVAVAWLAVVATLLRRSHPPVSPAACGAVAASALVLAALLHAAPGVPAALMLLALGFAAGDALLFGIAIAGGLVYLGRYYYQLELSLLDKAGVLAAAGAVLLALRVVLARWPAGEAK